MQAQQHSNKTFTIYTQNGQRKPGLRMAFVKVEMLAPWDTSLLSPDGSIFPLVFEKDVIDAFKANDTEVKCIVSFQVYTNGEAFAVARLHSGLLSANLQAYLTTTTSKN